MAWLPDTNVWIQILKNSGGKLEQMVLNHPPDQILLCSVLKAELWHGAHKYANTARRLKNLEKLFAGFRSLPFDDKSAWHYGGIRHQLEVAGCVIGPNDLKIAAICVANNLTLVTANTGEFARVSSLHVEDWSAA
jgi:tRNA(fMet)-specific endonuclease VapC